MSLDDLPPISEEARQRFSELEAQGDAAIDFSDIPELGEDAFKNAERGKFYRATKRQLTLRLDADILDWFKRNHPRGYQTAMNKVLVEYMLSQQREARKKAG